MTNAVLSDTRPPYVMSDDLARRIDELGVHPQCHQLEADGYCVIEGIAAPEWVERLRDTVLDLVGPGASAPMLLDKDPVFPAAVLNPKVLVLVEYLCGQGALVSQVTSSVRRTGAPPIGLHADQSWLPAPFPEHNYLLTACWVCEEFTKPGGATMVVPGSHRERRHPTAEEATRQDGAIAIECPPGSVAIWDGSVWHGNWPRTLDGERVTVHVTYSRLALRTVEDYSHLGDDFVARWGPAMGTLLGRDDFLGTANAQTGRLDRSLIVRTQNASKR